jgi:cation transport ATPase
MRWYLNATARQTGYFNRMRADSIQLRRFHRYLLYLVLLVLFFSGVAWAYMHYLSSRPDDLKDAVQAWALKIHGAAAMATLVLVGTVLTAHVKYAWSARRNRLSGIFFLTVFGILTVTAYGLYYFGDDRLRAWTSGIHLGIGLILPLFLLMHILIGRSRRPVSRVRKQALLRPSPSRVQA